MGISAHASVNRNPPDKLDLAARILCCPDCSVNLGNDMICPSCGRSFLPDSDGIIGALPRSMEADEQSKDQLQTAIDAEGREHAEKIVLYERVFHDEQAPYYDTLFADPLPLGKYYEWLVRHQIYAYVSGQHFVVDLCCGTGKSSMPLVERGLMVVGMDVSREMLRIYKQKCDAKGYQNILLIHADASRPPLRKQSCGAVQMIGGLHHIQEQAECVNACCGALQDNGVLILHEPLHTGRTSKLAKFLEDLYALMDPVRVLRAVGRRIGLTSRTRTLAEVPVPDFTPYEQPFTSQTDLVTLMPEYMEVLDLRSQGLMSFREFPPLLQGRFGKPVAAIVVRLDDWLGRRHPNDWLGDALFAAFRKRAR